MIIITGHSSVPRRRQRPRRRRTSNLLSKGLSRRRRKRKHQPISLVDGARQFFVIDLGSVLDPMAQPLPRDENQVFDRDRHVDQGTFGSELDDPESQALPMVALPLETAFATYTVRNINTTANAQVTGIMLVKALTIATIRIVPL